MKMHIPYIPEKLESRAMVQLPWPDGSLKEAEVVCAFGVVWLLAGPSGFSKWWDAWGFTDPAKDKFVESIVGYVGSGGWPEMQSADDLRMILLACWAYAIEQWGSVKFGEPVVPPTPIEQRTRRLRIITG